MQTSLFAGTEDPVLGRCASSMWRSDGGEVVEQVRRWQKELGGK